VLVYFHGGGFRSGHKNREAKPLLHRLGRRGWLCISANYRLEPRAGYPDFLVDARRALAWVRQHASAYGADPERVWLAGSSAGGYLATMTGLGGAASLVPGPDDGAPPGSPIEGVIGLYAFYGSPGAPADVAASPGDHVHRAAPPMFLAHGDRDTIVLVDDARTFAGRLAATSDSPVVYAELPGGQHGFDLFRSARFEAVVDAIEIFVDRVGRQRSGGQASACSGGEPGGDEAGAE
jgi:acetyl esterase/lipase